MAAYLIRRVLLFIPTLWVAITLVFIIFRLIPGDPAQLAAGESASQEVVEYACHEGNYAIRNMLTGAAAQGR